MERIRLTDPADPRFGEAFALYEISFPVYERRTRAAQAARLSHPEYHFDLLVEVCLIHSAKHRAEPLENLFLKKITVNMH